MERELDFLARLVDPPLHGGERDLERLGDLGVREADDVAQEQRHLEVGVERLDRSPHGVDRLGALGRRVDDLERRRVVDVHDGARTALDRAELVEHAVLRHLEQPRREARPKREARQSLEDPEEDLLRQILGEAAVTGQTQDVVVDRLLVRPNDDRERTLVAPLGLTQNAEIWLWQRHVRGEYRGRFVKASGAGQLRRALRADSLSCQRESRAPSIPRMVGARSDSCPCVRSSKRSLGDDERHEIRRVRGVRADPVGLEHLLRVAVIGGHQTDTTGRMHARRRPVRAHDPPPRRRRSTAGIEPVCPTMSGFAKFTTANA